MEATEHEGKAAVSLALGIGGLIAWLIPFIGAPITIVGLVQGIKGLDSSKRGMARAGIALSIIGLVLTTMNFAVGAYMGVTGQHPLVNAIRARTGR